jgi:hypothetical protein
MKYLLGKVETIITTIAALPFVFVAIMVVVLYRSAILPLLRFGVRRVAKALTRR